MSSRRDLPPSLTSRAFAVHEALEAGVPGRRLDARDLRRPFHGVRAPVDELPELSRQCAALSTRFREGDAFAGPTAARLWGMPVPLRLESGPLFVASIRPVHPMRRRGVVGVLRDHGRTVEHRGLPILAPVDAWVDLCAHVGLDDAVAAGDWLVTGHDRRPPVVGLDRLHELLEAMKGRRGAPHARRALALVGAGARSAPESHLRLLLIRHGIPEPRLNLQLDSGLIPDLSWPEYLVAAEYNGSYHDSADQRSRDLRRAEAMSNLGWSTVNVDRNDLYRAPGSTVSRVAQRLRSRGWLGSIQWPKTTGGSARY